MEALSITHTALWDGKYLDHQGTQLTENDLVKKIKSIRDKKHEGDLLPFVKVKLTERQLESA